MEVFFSFSIFFPRSVNLVDYDYSCDYKQTRDYGKAGFDREIMVEKALIWTKNNRNEFGRAESCFLGDSSYVREYTCECDCGLLNGSDVAFQHTNLDQLPHSSINIGLGTTFRPSVSSTNHVVLERIGGPGVLPSIQATQAPANPPIAITIPKVGGNVSNDAFFRPLLGLVMTVGIADQLADLPFGLVHPRLVLAFSIVVFGSLGDIVQLRGIARRYADCSISPPI
uniref:Uncharacterized protein n=1 Tax=Solanum tuberosum TaxID=4113 RepID=M1DAE0_SOLTU